MFLLLSYSFKDFGSKKLADHINSNKNLTWKAASYSNLPKFETFPRVFSFEEAQKDVKSLRHHKNAFLPAYFDFLERYPSCSPSIFDQKNDFSCYISSVLTTASMRHCQLTSGLFDFNISEILSICPMVSKKGGHEYLVWRCLDRSFGDKMKFDSLESFRYEEDIKEEIYKNGPVVALMDIPLDFGNYRSGVYFSDDSSPGMLHTVVLYGWGSDDSIKYWKAINSYGPEWGERGRFKIIRGLNHRDIESYCTSMNLIKNSVE